MAPSKKRQRRGKGMAEVTRDSEVESAGKKRKTEQRNSETVSSGNPQKTEETGGSKLLVLPDEVLVKIMTSLPFRDIVKSRRICRKLNEMFPKFCVEPVVDYLTKRAFMPLCETEVEHRRIVKSVTSTWTRSLTIMEPRNSSLLILTETIVNDLKERCPSLKRLILKKENAFSGSFGNLPFSAVRALPSTLELELHDIALLNGQPWESDNVFISGTNIFRGPFDNWTKAYVLSICPAASTARMIVIRTGGY